MNDSVELRKYVTIVLHRWWLVLLSALVAAAAGYGVSLRQEPVYQATASVIVGQSLRTTQLDATDIATSERLALTYADIARRQPVLDATIISLGLVETWDNLRQRVKVNLVPNTQLLEISVEATSREEAKLLAGELVQQLIFLSPASQKNQGADSTALFVQQRIQDLQTNIEQGEAQVERLTSALITAEMPEEKASIQGEIDDLESRILDWENTYARYLSFVGSDEPVNYISVVDSARVEPHQIRPDIRLNTLVAGVVGSMLAAGIIFLFEFLDDTLKTQDDIQQELDLPPLGIIGQLGNGALQEKMVVSEKPFAPATESYRMIRSNIEFATLGLTGKSILVTSPGQEDGKSVTTINLAIAMAQNGQRTIIVDSDLRKPALHKAFQVPNREGLSDQLCRSAPGESIPLHDLKVDGLCLLTAGTTPPNPAELLGSQRMKELLASLKELSDVVILDTPPASLVADPLVLSGQVDGVILVFRAGKTRREVARQAVSNLQQAGANILGAVLNQVAQSPGERYRKYAAYGDDQKHRGSRRDLSEVAESA